MTELEAYNRTGEKLDRAISEYIRDRQEMHGFNQATRDECYARLRELETVTSEVAGLCKRLGLTDDQPYDLSMSAADAMGFEGELVLALVTHEMEKA